MLNNGLVSKYSENTDSKKNHGRKIEKKSRGKREINESRRKKSWWSLKGKNGEVKNWNEKISREERWWKERNKRNKKERNKEAKNKQETKKKE